MSIDYEALAKNGMTADQLAVTFLGEYYKNKEITYPINPFQIHDNDIPLHTSFAII